MSADGFDKFLRAFGITADSLVHPSGECRCNYPGSIIVCTLPFAHDGDHKASPIRLNSGRMSDPVRWPQDRPQGADQ